MQAPVCAALATENNRRRDRHDTIWDKGTPTNAPLSFCRRLAARAAEGAPEAAAAAGGSAKPQARMRLPANKRALKGKTAGDIQAASRRCVKPRHGRGSERWLAADRIKTAAWGYTACVRLAAGGTSGGRAREQRWLFCAAPPAASFSRHEPGGMRSDSANLTPSRQRRQASAETASSSGVPRSWRASRMRHASSSRR